jgi:hypothetical protein
MWRLTAKAEIMNLRCRTKVKKVSMRINGFHIITSKKRIHTNNMLLTDNVTLTFGHFYFSLGDPLIWGGEGRSKKKCVVFVKLNKTRSPSNFKHMRRLISLVVRRHCSSCISIWIINDTRYFRRKTAGCPTNLQLLRKLCYWTQATSSNIYFLTLHKGTGNLSKLHVLSDLK